MSTADCTAPLATWVIIAQSIGCGFLGGMIALLILRWREDA